MLTLSGVASAALYQQALDSVRFSNTSDAPDTTARIIEVSVNSGIASSPVAVATIGVIAVDDPMIANNDVIVTNYANSIPISVPLSALLANDVDPDSPLAITSITSQNSLTATLGTSSVAVTDTGGTAGGSFIYRGTGIDTATVTLVRDTTGAIDGTNASEILIGDGAANKADILNGNGGNDIIYGLTGDDLLYGGSGQDTLYGGAGSDTLDFNSLNDVPLIGNGAPGAVTAATLMQLELIADFTQGQDRIDLSTIDAMLGNAFPGDQAFTFLGTDSFNNANANGGLRYYQMQDANGQWYTIVEASTDSDTAAEFQLALLGKINLHAPDFGP